MSQKILKFNKPPLMESILEFRFEQSDGLINILPGLLKEIQELQYLPLNNIPLNIRQSDPNLEYAPLLRLEIKDYVILLGDKVVGIGCKHSYPGWQLFKNKAQEILELILTSPLSKNFIINRYSIKYINFFESIESLSFTFNLGNFSNVNNVVLKTELNKEGFIHGIQIVSTATVKNNGKIKNGTILDIDSIKIKKMEYLVFVNELKSNLDSIHDSNKDIFIEILEKETINKMEPRYEK